MAGWWRRLRGRLGGGLACNCLLLLSALALAWAAEEEAAAARAQTFPQPLSNLAASARRLLVASGNRWYEVEPSLAWAKEHRSSPALDSGTTVNKLLLPFGNDRLLTCWTQPHGSCYEERLGADADANATVFGEEVVTCLRNGSAAGWIYALGSEWRLVVATSRRLNDSSDLDPECLAKGDSGVAVALQERQKAVSEDHRLLVSDGCYLHFADAFLWSGQFFFPYYHYSLSMEPKMLVANQMPANRFFGHGQAILRCGGGGFTRRILSSNYVQERGLWVGVFGSAEGPATPTSTALCIFSLSQVSSVSEGCALGDSNTICAHEPAETCNKIAWPINNATLLSHSDLVSVYATVVLNKIVLFLGTRNGQLLKVILDENMKANCPDILYEIEEETPIFHKLELDPVNKDYIYLPSGNKIWRTKVANCSKYISCKECLTAMDPHCGWCYSYNNCTLKGECPVSNNIMNWTSIPYGTDKCLKIYTSKHYRGEISVTAVGNSEGPFTCRVIDVNTKKILCENVKEDVMNCSCHLKAADLVGKVAQVLLISGSQTLSEIFKYDCSFEKTCSECLSRAGCTWSTREKKCVSSTVTCTQKVDCDSITTSASDGKDISQRPELMHITSIEPMWISTLGSSEILIRGENFSNADVLMEMTGTSSCKSEEIFVTKVLNRTHMKFCLPPSRKEAKSICIKKIGFPCSLPVTLSYVSLPACTGIFPNVTWKSGGRNMTIRGRHLNVTEMVSVLDGGGQNLAKFTCRSDRSECNFTTPAVNTEKSNVKVVLKVETKNIPCIEFRYEPDPEFIHYELTTDLHPVLELKIHKKNDGLNISKREIDVFMSCMAAEKLLNITFTVQNISQTESRSTIYCRAQQTSNDNIDTSSVKVYVKLGNFKQEVPKEAHNYSYLTLLLLIPVVIAVAIFVTQRKSKQLNRKLSEHLELLECELRKEIREGFVELQMEKLDVVDSFGTIPFLDYKHFLIRTSFPEAGGTSFILIEDSSEPLSRNPEQKDESITALYALICNKHFLVTLIHTLEKQKTFSVKDRCLFASFLTIALQTNLVYLTHILEVLTRDLMEQSSNIQPKLLLRRTESVVEKLLTNWMSVCLSGFLRETFGDPFYMLVTTLNQRINRGPVDVITCKALNTLNEDWLLWQVTEFNTVELNVVFENIPQSECEGTFQTIQVNVLDCDTIGQAKEKILQVFLNKNGSLYDLQLNEMALALQSGAQTTELLDIDSSSEILENGITKLNTIRHYAISDGATIKIFKKKTDLSACFSDGEYPNDYCHLIIPDSEAAKDTQGAKHKGKQKFKVKEMYLTKLLSTKVAIHSVVEELFRSIWTLPNNKAPVAVKYFFDFLDAQAENKKITDPDVVHIWKTNSLPLRFWVNILKNPQFVFDIKKTPHLDGCLSVIAQAFMDAFSLSEQQLGKEAPTNKLLYAKDIPLYKEEVKAFYKAIRDLPSLSTSELEEFLTQESKKHENEFNESAALTKIYHYIARYYDDILNKLEKERGLEEAQKQLLYIKALADEKKKCKWISDESTAPLLS
ncbi:plexin-C1 [Podarcis raffonei]|uniref:plexin-C1 n=1 Tax=Podarcis raffonei TaxID=65483 RepID=UPI0023293835|nr:plexin-C1 [Podarcis raffonei]